MSVEIQSIEKEAHRLLDEQNYHDACELFQKAAVSYKKSNKHHQAALCYASAAGCWEVKSGENVFHRASKDYERAAREAELSGDLEYTALLYKHAAVCYERDQDYEQFSNCFYKSKEFYRKYVGRHLFSRRKVLDENRNKKTYGFKDIAKRLGVWLVMTFSSLIWGYGERPFKTVVFGGGFIFFCALLYTQGHLLRDGSVFQPNILEAIYFSVITFTTVGYGDMVPVGFSKSIVVIEAFSGIFIFPVFVTALCRKYLRF